MLSYVQAIAPVVMVLAPFAFIHVWLLWIREGKIHIQTIKVPGGTEIGLGAPPASPPNVVAPITAIVSEAPPEAKPPSENGISTEPWYDIIRRLYAAKPLGSHEVENCWSQMSKDVNGLSGEKREVVETEYRRIRLKLGDGSAVSELAALVNENPRWRRPVMSLADHHLALMQYDEARRWCLVAKDRAVADGNHTNAFATLIEIEHRQKGSRLATQYAFKLLPEVKLAETRASVYGKLAEIHSAESQYQRAAAYYHLALRERPNDTNLRFSAAYNLSRGTDLHLVSFAHYRILERISPSKDYVLNNIASMCDELGAPVLGGTYLERAKAINNNIASANVATKLARIGLFDLGRAALADANGEVDMDRITTASNDLNAKENKVPEILSRLDSQSNAALQFHEAYASLELERAGTPHRPIQDGTWVAEGMTVETDANEIASVAVILRRDKSKYTGQLKISEGVYSGWLQRQEPTMLVNPYPEWLDARAIYAASELVVLLQGRVGAEEGSGTVEVVRALLTPP